MYAPSHFRDDHARCRRGPPDAGVDLRDVQIRRRHSDPRTTMRYDRARQNLNHHPNYILAAYMASGTRPSQRLSRLGPREAPDIAE